MIDNLFKTTDDKHADLLRKSIGLAKAFDSKTFNITLPIMVQEDCISEEGYATVEIMEKKNRKGWLYWDVHAFVFRWKGDWLFVPSSGLKDLVSERCVDKNYSEILGAGSLQLDPDTGRVTTVLKVTDVLELTSYYV